MTSWFLVITSWVLVITIWFRVNTSWFLVMTRKQPSRLLFAQAPGRMYGKAGWGRGNDGWMMDDGKKMVDFCLFLSFSTVYQSFQDI